MSVESRTESIAVIGGGIAGLTAAYYLAKSGLRVQLFEASDQLGGLGTFFTWNDKSFERFYHCMLPNDEGLLALLDELQLLDKVYWRESSFASMHCGKCYPLNTPYQLLRFSPLSFWQRVRVGITGLWGSHCSSAGLDARSAEQWLIQLSGQGAYQKFFRPMLQAKFGALYSQVPALWFWQRFNREKGSRKEIKGYLRQGYRRIVESLAYEIKKYGGEIILECPVQSLCQDVNGQLTVSGPVAGSRQFRKVIATCPLPQLLTFCDPSLLSELPEQTKSLDYQGVINVVLFLRSGLLGHYWVSTVDEDVPFQGMIESTTLIDISETDGLHLVYLTKYLHRSEPEFAYSDQEILADFVKSFLKLLPQVSETDIVHREVFRAPFVEPIYSLHYSQRQPPCELLKGKFFFVSASQVYPDVTSWNGLVTLVQKLLPKLGVKK